MRPIAAAAIAACLVSCMTDLSVPSGATVTCNAAQPSCPSGYACDATLGLCLPTDLVVPTITVAEAVASNGALWVDTTAITLSFALPVGAAPPTTVAISGDVTTPGSVAYAATLPTTLTAGNGDKTVQLAFTDAAGSFAPPVPLALRLDTASPTSSVVVSAPTLTAGEVALPDVYVNADTLSIPFASVPPTPADDFAGYVFSIDGGATWNPTPAPLVLSPLAQDTATNVWIRERNVFGKMTPQAQQGVVTIHEDSQPPSAPGALVPLVIANLNSEAGVMVQPSVDGGGGPVRYEVIGGSYTDYTPIGTRPLIRFSGVETGQLSVYLVHGVDRAGNASPALSIPVGDDSVVTTGIVRTAPTRQDFWGGNGMGAFVVVDGGVNFVEMCPLDGSGNAGCGEYELPTPTTSVLRSPSIYQRNAVFEEFNSSSTVKPLIAFINVGPDGKLDFSPNDDSARVNLDFGHCPVAGPGGIVYGKWLATSTYQPTFYRYGADGIANTGDSGEGSVVLSTNGRVMSGNPCWPQFNGRQIMWVDVRATGASTWTMYDLGPDRAFGTADDIPETTVTTDDIHSVALGDSGLAIHTGRDRTVQWTDFGPDFTFGTGDDSTSTIVLDDLSIDEGVPMPQARDGKILGIINNTAVLYDRGAHSAVTLHSSLAGDGTLGTLSLGPAMIFGSLTSTTIDKPDLLPAYFQFTGEPMSYRFDIGSSRGAPSGSWAGEFVLLPATRLQTKAVVSLTGGGAYYFGDPAPADTAVDVSAEGLVVWIDSSTHALMLLGVGPDKHFGTADDLGPVVVPTNNFPTWPRVAAGRVVWAEVASANWQSGPLTSNVVVLALGADGWLSADDVPTPLTSAGTQAGTLALAGDKLAYLDFATPGTGECLLNGRSGVSRVNCKSALMEVDLVSGTTATLSSTPIYRDGVRVLADGRATWLQDNGVNNDLHVWDGSADRVVVSATTGTSPELDGTHFAYFMNSGPVVIDAGADSAFATADDVVLRNGFTGTFNLGAVVNEPPYRRWLGPDGLLVGAGALPITDDAQIYAGTSAVAIADGSTVTDAVTIGGAPADLVQDMTIAVAIAHGSPADLLVTLTSPTGDTVALLQHANVDVSNLSFDLTSLPALLNHWGEPIAGEWLLTIVDTANGTGGTLTSWSITHRP